MKKEIIPKKLHYCWFGGNKKPALVQKCIDSWKRFCPNYEIIEWNETNFDINSNIYIKEAYEAKKWAFVTDYVRLFVLVKYGGVYLDSDVELFSCLDDFLSNVAFTGFESKDSPITAIMGCAKNYYLFKELLDYYSDKHFLLEDGTYDIKTNTETITDCFIKKGIKLNGKKQTISDCVIYPEIFFCPCTFGMIFNHYSKKTIASHHFMGSWGMNGAITKRSFIQRIRMFLIRKARNIFGSKRISRLKK